MQRCRDNGCSGGVPSGLLGSFQASFQCLGLAAAPETSSRPRSMAFEQGARPWRCPGDVLPAFEVQLLFVNTGVLESTAENDIGKRPVLRVEIGRAHV